MDKHFFTFSRHDLLFLKRDFVPFLCCNENDKDRIAKWIREGFPVIVRRPGCCKDGIHCGIPLPPAEGKKRLSFIIPVDAIKEKKSLPSLSSIEYKKVKNFASFCNKNGFEPKVFGSLAWETITGMKYLTENSDIDLLLNINSESVFKPLLSFLLSVPEELIKQYDIEINLRNGDAFSWKEFRNTSSKIMVKNIHDVFTINKSELCNNGTITPERIAYEASSALYEELETYPKPGLVSYFDSGSHKDMDSSHFRKSTAALKGYFIETAQAGMNAGSMAELRRLGINAEEQMLAATNGINTHKGAIFSLGLLTAAAGYKIKTQDKNSLGSIVKKLWANGIMDSNAIDKKSHGYKILELYGLGGAREEAANGFPSIYAGGLAAFKKSLTEYDRNTARLSAFLSLLENTSDTTLLYRGGREGYEFAIKSANSINQDYKTGGQEWANAILKLHNDFISRNLSAGGVADLLSCTIFIQRMEELCQA